MIKGVVVVNDTLTISIRLIFVKNLVEVYWLRETVVCVAFCHSVVVVWGCGVGEQKNLLFLCFKPVCKTLVKSEVLLKEPWIEEV